MERLPPIRTNAGDCVLPWVLGGALLALLIELLVGGVAAGALVLHPGMLGYLLCLAVAVPSLGDPRTLRVREVFYVSAGLVLADLPSMIVRIDAPAQAASFPVLALGGGLALAYGLAETWIPGRDAKPRRLGLPTLLGVLALAAAVVAASQGVNRLLLAAGVPNEERSFLLGGHEIHHINYGFLLLPLARLAFTRAREHRGVGVSSLVLVAVALGFIADQCVYYMLRAVTDEAYFSSTVVLGGIGGLALMAAGMLRLCGRSAADRES